MRCALISGDHFRIHQMDGNLYLGTSGFAYDEWKHGVFYPRG